MPPSLDNGVCVTVCEAMDIWDLAKATCTSAPWTFAVVDTQDKLDDLPRLNGSVWVSLARGVLVGGTDWQWVPTTGMTVKGWDSGQPSGIANCGVVNPNHKLATAGCTEQHKFLCTAPPVR